MKKIITIIPTINRIDTIKRAINSVLNQEVLPDKLIIVYEKYKKNYKELENLINKINSPLISIIPNQKSNNLSGNINTGLEYIQNKYKKLDKLFISILDDDDEYLPSFLKECLQAVDNKNIIGVFAPIVWKLKKETKIYHIEESKLTAKEFFIGNPGVQGSNMFIRADIFTELKFDESLISTTDRDFMIRFLRYKEMYNKNIKVLKTPLVIYYSNENRDRLTINRYKKELGLRAFYNKYQNDFSKKDLEISLKRANTLFNYSHNKIKGKIVIGMAFKNEIEKKKKAVKSIFNQKDVKRDVILLIINDGSYNELKKAIQSFLDKENLFIHSVNIKNISKVRNYIIDFSKKIVPDVDYICRLDADDYLADEFVLSKIEKIMDKYNPDVILAGNNLSLNGKILEKNNYASKKLLDFNYLEKILYKMSEGIAENELPSCNIFIKPAVKIKYKEVESAEDHWFLVDILLNKNEYSIFIAENILYSVYSLNGELTKSNRKKNLYFKSRKQLLNYFLEKKGE